ncbi:hypothetical protein EA658_15520 [Pseudoxanthomonas winnipegensis]|jgi:hypothetical protein|uniref:EF-hand domain-containing protein n=1 Tax=Pseudoxanthomonas winnipegensis TaxID=2480810 RepID=A0ABY1WC09_9GAMM|nr:hypothetical protein [Pseudoxanthomonas winnipegensis]TAA11085.1 hypothetical protein EA659_06930 [Pseudoxanthomonas winnipegensis]TAA18511.1 hypothetical protein EA658_15520 [Pseudoxanthomonas winnipegensis]TAH74113.1 hypothetical protein EA657_01225 [Pseudoxanthomonas winnipegensis]
MNKLLTASLAVAIIAVLALAAGVQGGSRSKTMPEDSVPSTASGSNDVNAMHVLPSSEGNDKEPGAPSDALVVDFNRAKNCYLLSNQLSSLERVLTTCEALEPGKGVQPDPGYAMCSSQSDQRLSEIDRIKGAMSNCSADPSKLKRDYLISLDHSALQGDADAQMCFIALASSDSSFATRIDERIKSYAEAAFSRGDWRIVAELESAMPLSQGVLQKAFGNGVATSYKMNRLLRRAATGPYADILDKESEEFLRAVDPSGNRYIDPDEVGALNQWVEEQYKQHFSRSPELTQKPNLCSLN